MKKAIWLVMFLLILVSISSCNRAAENNSNLVNANAEILQEEYEVYSAALKQIPLILQWKSDVKNNPVILEENDMITIEENTENKHIIDKRAYKYYKNTVKNSFDKKIVAEYNSINKSSYKLKNNFVYFKRIVLISEKEQDTIFRSSDTLNDKWKRFYNKYDGSFGLVKLSRVAFNDGKNIAFFCYGAQYGGEMGGGYYLTLKKEDNEWKVIDKTVAWKS